MREKVLLVGVSNRATPRALAEEHLDELERLVDTAGGGGDGRDRERGQRRHDRSIHSGTV